MPAAARDRRAVIADAGIELLATHGIRGLTHRGIDAFAALPPGSTSFYARTRAALLTLVVDRLAELDLDTSHAPPSVTPVVDADSLAAALAPLVHAQITVHAARSLARHELTLESRRQPSIAAALANAGQRFEQGATELMRAAGSADPPRHGRALVAICDGLVLHTLSSTDRRQVTQRQLQQTLREVVRGMLGTHDSGPAR